jgi:beta-1,2-mannobiose phosphorylase / 1,2-beta-oligomannan phosphorylase
MNEYTVGPAYTILERYDNNPILTPSEKNWWESRSVFNCASLYDGKKVHLLYRAVGEHKDYISRIGYASSNDGFTFTRNNDMATEPVEAYERYGIEDPRLFQLESRAYFTYVVPSNYVREFPTVSTALATTEDYSEFTRLGLITPKLHDDKDVVYFSAKMAPTSEELKSSNRPDGKCYFSLHRPSSWIGSSYGVDKPSIWLAESFSLTNFQRYSILLKPEQDWEAAKVGAGPPPIRTRRGWLVIYHGVSNSKIYRAGAAVLDLNEPNRILGRCKQPILEPEREYETSGDVNNVVFPCGACVIDGKLFIYYGGADRVCCLATANLDSLVKYVLEGN